MSKYIGYLAVAVLVIFMLFGDLIEESNMNPLDYTRITDVDYRAVVVDEPEGNGKMVVTERLTFDIHAASQSNRFWELWRDLSEEYIDGVKVEYQVNSVKQLLADGSEVVYQESPRLYWEDYDFMSTASGLGPGKWFHSEGPYNENRMKFECVFFYVDGLYREQVVFEIEYEMTNAALRYNDCSELYITPYSEGDIVYLNSFTGEILVPNEIMPRPGNYEAHTYGTNANDFPLTESATANPGYHTFSFGLDESQLKFRSYNQYIEFTLVSYGEDKHIFTQNASVNDYYYDDVLAELREEQAKYDATPGTYRTAKIIVCVFSIAIAILIVLLVVFRTDKKIRKKHVFFEPAEQMSYFRDIPSALDPIFASALVFSKQKPPRHARDDGYAAVMLSLVHKRYIELAKIDEGKDWTFSNVKIIEKYKSQGKTDLESLTPTEALYFNLIYRHTHGCDLPLSAFQKRVSEDYENTNAFVGNIEKAIINVGISQGYFQKADYKQPAKEVKKRALRYTVMAAILMVLGNLVSFNTRMDLAFGAYFILGLGLLISAFYLRKISHRYVLLTQFGEDEYARWQQFYGFLNSEAHMKEGTVTDLGLWEQYLIYATAFGMAEKVSSALNVKAHYVNMSPVLYNPYYRSRHFRIGHRRFRTATRSASYRARSAGFSSGFGGHGGYGGGGRGGGGGGGGH